VARGQPVLVGTASIEVSEMLSEMLKKAGIEHQVLNAKHHEQEARIVAEAGKPGAVTIATNMAGRGTDIVLGGNLEVELEELGPDATEEHRQGDPGSSRFYLSLEDSLMRIFASERVGNLMQKLGMKEGEAIEHPWVNKAIENAQRKVEGRNFDIRKQLLEYDDVANDQRKVVYEQRNELMDVDDISENIGNLRHDVLMETIDQYIPPQSIEEQWDVPGLEEALKEHFALDLPIQKWLDEDDDLHEETLRRRILEELEKRYAEKEALIGSDQMRYLEKAVMLQTLDTHWKEHLAAMDYLRQGIHLRGFAQKNPKQEYKREAFEMFASMLEAIKREVVEVLSKFELQEEPRLEMQPQPAEFEFKHEEFAGLAGEVPEEQPEMAQPAKPYVREGRKVGRNEPCPCGSGKKYKHCCGRLQ